MGQLAEKYPLTTDIITTGIANTGYQLSQGGEYDPYSLLQSELSTVLTRGRGLDQQISINIGIGLLAAENNEDYGWNTLGAVGSSIGSIKLSTLKSGNKFLDYVISPVIVGGASEYLGDSNNLKYIIMKEDYDE
ncbi:hypothetical protein EV694_0116 [Volucribacter psittacicida]|uniref:Uncharacterized protein n=1 Tax=Volucribacter psittacicida TaxID=203482 RepID=A0A4R1G4T4_9PAST|nr:hypothetical protein [Volucribacter psittacicida]TCK01503.1 hypothetical protein EV694_0116 [Volucribacter psittacicida]